MSDPIRDDTMPAFPPPKVVGEIVGQFVPAEQCEPFPLYSFAMPPVRETRPQFVPRAMCQRVIDSIGQTDAEFAEAIGALQEFLEGGPNNNSGARAPIQGE